MYGRIIPCPEESVNLKIQLRCHIAVNIVTDRFFHKLLRDTEPLCQIPDLTAAFGNGFIQGILRHQLQNRPFVSPVFMALSQIVGGIAVVEAAGQAMPQLMTKVGTLLDITIQNNGTTPATATDNIVITDVFDPILNITSVTFNGVQWFSPQNYTYNSATGLFSTVNGQITVPAASYSQDPSTGVWTLTPGSSTLSITGTL